MSPEVQTSFTGFFSHLMMLHYSCAHKPTECFPFALKELMQTTFKHACIKIHTQKLYQQTPFELLHMLNKSIQLSFVLRMRFLFPIKIKMYFYMPNAKQQNVQWQHSVWGTREVFVPANKYTLAIFCSSKIRYLGQGVRSFLLGLSGETCFVLRLRSEINEKPFDFPSKERVQAGRNCELRWGECRMPPTKREREEGNTLIKQFLLIIMLFGFLFLFCIADPVCHFAWEWFDTATFATVHVFVTTQCHSLWHSIKSYICLLK